MVNLQQPSDPQRAAELVAGQQLERQMVGEAAQRIRGTGAGLREPSLTNQNSLKNMVWEGIN